MIPRRKIYQPIVRGMPKKMLRAMTFCLLQDTRKLAHYFESAGQNNKSVLSISKMKQKKKKSRPSCKSFFSCKVMLPSFS